MSVKAQSTSTLGFGFLHVIVDLQVILPMSSKTTILV